jgi:hypothetical protein
VFRMFAYIKLERIRVLGDAPLQQPIHPQHHPPDQSGIRNLPIAHKEIFRFPSTMRPITLTALLAALAAHASASATTFNPLTEVVPLIGPAFLANLDPTGSHTRNQQRNRSLPLHNRQPLRQRRAHQHRPCLFVLRHHQRFPLQLPPRRRGTRTGPHGWESG